MERVANYSEQIIKKFEETLGVKYAQWAFTAMSVYSGIQSLMRVKAFASGFRKNVATSKKNLADRYGKGTWVLITGGSDGIGKAFANELASQGFNLCLIARSAEKLNTVAKELETKYKIETKTIAVDFTQCTTIFDHEYILNQLGDLDISILINGVGMVSCLPFHKMEYSHLQDYISVNILPQLSLSRFVIEKMTKRERRSAIINMASGVVHTGGLKYFSMYSSTKYFNHMFSLAMAEEFKDKIDIMSLTPGEVSTNMLAQFGFRGLGMDPARFAKSALTYVGTTDQTTGHWQFEIEYAAGKALLSSGMGKTIKGGAMDAIMENYTKHRATANSSTA